MHRWNTKSRYNRPKHGSDAGIQNVDDSHSNGDVEHRSESLPQPLSYASVMPPAPSYNPLHHAVPNASLSGLPTTPMVQRFGPLNHGVLPPLTNLQPLFAPPVTPWPMHAAPAFPSYPMPGALPVNGGFLDPGHQKYTSVPAEFPGRRGPPVKPKETGHALWVGNLPEYTAIEDLVDHFAQGLKDGIESVYLMPRNCAFVNYGTEEACKKAIGRFNGVFFGGNPLLCRLKAASSDERPKDDAPAPSRNDSVASSLETSDAINAEFKRISVEDQAKISDSTTDKDPAHEQPRPSTAETRYFILKAMEVEDLWDSCDKGMWTPQPRVQKILHEAFREYREVILIFSVNKSGQYFGYAKMQSSPLENNASTQRSFDTSQFWGVRVYPTAETENVPEGSVTCDPARKIIFWEAVRGRDGDAEGINTLRPFRLQWLSHTPVSFTHVRGMRNPWNENKELKIAKDGTEVEPSVGERLVDIMQSAARVQAEGNGVV